MKLSNFLVGALVCAMAAACTNDETAGSNDLPQGNGEQAFIAVRLMAPNTMTKATSFEDGSATENDVDKARFYFFDASGNDVEVGNSVNYIDVTDDINFSDPNVDNIEKRATIVALNGKAATPAQMVVVLNPKEATPASTNLSTLLSQNDDYLTGCTEEGKFVMSNSVYSDGSKVVNAVDVASYIAPTAAAASASPVTVYVERAVAKVEVSNSSNNVSSTTASFDTGEDFNGGSGDQDVKAKIIGWDIVNRSSKSYLVKNLKKDWLSSQPFANWNEVSKFRSYWAQCPTGVDAENTLSYSDVTMPTGGRYCQERTEATNPATLLVTAQLRLGDAERGTTIAEYAGQYWTLSDLKKQIAGQINGTSATTPIYYKSESGTPSTWTALNAGGSPEALIDFRARTESEKENFKAYQSIPTLAESYTSGYSFAKDAQGTSEYNDVSEVNAVLAQYPVLIWDEGKTYYYVPIEHVAKATSQEAINGVVRNHWYKINITGVKGLGTPIPPVSNPDDEEPIDPEKPENKDTYLAASINILNWAIVSQDVTLGQ